MRVYILTPLMALPLNVSLSSRAITLEADGAMPGVEGKVIERRCKSDSATGAAEMVGSCIVAKDESNNSIADPQLGKYILYSQ